MTHAKHHDLREAEDDPSCVCHQLSARPKVHASSPSGTMPLTTETCGYQQHWSTPLRAVHLN